jgi:exonuclease VII large subunit
MDKAVDQQQAVSGFAAARLAELHAEMRAKLEHSAPTPNFAAERPAPRKLDLRELHASLSSRLSEHTEVDECEETLGQVIHRRRKEREAAHLAARAKRISDRELRRSLGLAPRPK